MGGLGEDQQHQDGLSFTARITVLERFAFATLARAHPDQLAREPALLEAGQRRGAAPVGRPPARTTRPRWPTRSRPCMPSRRRAAACCASRATPASRASRTGSARSSALAHAYQRRGGGRRAPVSGALGRCRGPGHGQPAHGLHQPGLWLLGAHGGPAGAVGHRPYGRLAERRAAVRIRALPLHAWVPGAAHRAAALRRALQPSSAQAFWQAPPSIIARACRAAANTTDDAESGAILV